MSRLLSLFAVALAAATFTNAPARAASSQWVESEGGSVRLVAGDTVRDGILRGALQIRLKPGWKTYWRDPGGSGVPPQIDISASSNVASAGFRYPPPKRIDDGNTQTAGYDNSVTLPVEFRIADAGTPPDIQADVFLGICKTICIPVQGQFALEGRSTPADDALVAESFSRLPAKADQQFGVTGVKTEGDMLTLETALPPGAGNAQLFVASAHGYLFGLPDPADDGEQSAKRFTAPIFARPDEPQDKRGALSYTLVTDRGAVSGLFTIP